MADLIDSFSPGTEAQVGHNIDISEQHEHKATTHTETEKQNIKS